jgi:hypothetical protein
LTMTTEISTSGLELQQLAIDLTGDGFVK